MGKLVGYARVSTDEQDVELQLDALREAGCRDELIFVDKVSGARSSRPGLDACLERAGVGRYATWSGGSIVSAAPCRIW